MFKKKTWKNVAGQDRILGEGRNLVPRNAPGLPVIRAALSPSSRFPVPGDFFISYRSCRER